MKRDFLKSLGIEDKDIIDKILDENSADIGRAKGELDTWKTKVTDLENDIKTKESTIAQLQKEADKVEGLNQTISQLQTDKTNLETELTAKVSEITRDHEIENKIRDKKGLNVKAIKALLDKEKDIDEQLDTLSKAEDSAMLFGTAVQAPAGTHPATPNSGSASNPSTSNSFADAVAKALSK